MPATHTADFQTATVKATNLDAVEQINVGIETEQDRKQLNIVANAPEIRIQDKTATLPDEVNETTMAIIADGGTTHFRAGTETFSSSETKGNIKFQSSTGATTHAEIVGSSGTLELQDGGLGLKRGSNVSVSGTPSAVIQEITGPHARESAVLKKYPEVVFADGKFEYNDESNTYMQGGYTVSTNSVYQDRHVYRAFDDIDDPGPGFTYSSEDVGGNGFSQTTGLPISGVTFQDENSTSYTGHYIKVELPKKIKLSSIYLSSRNQENNLAAPNDKRPTSGTFLGSNDGTNWTLLKTFNDGELTWSSNTFGTNASFHMTNITNVVNDGYFSYIVFLIEKIKTTNAYGVAEITQLKYYGYEEVGAGDDSVDVTVKSVYNAPDLTNAALYIDGLKGSTASNQISGGVPTTGNNAEYDIDGEKAWTLTGAATSNIVSNHIASLVGDHPHSISAWVKADQLNGDGLFHVGTADGAGDAASRVGFVDDSHISWGGEDHYFSNAEWHNCTYTYNGEGSDKKLYLDGRRVGTAKNEDTFGDYPPFAMTTHSAYGYTASASSEFSGDYPAWEAFNKTHADNGDTWLSVNAQNYNGGSGAYSGSANLGSDSGGVAFANADKGEWLKMEMPHKMVLDYIDICGSTSNSVNPKDWKIYGSNDGKNWDVLLSKTNSVTAAYNVTVGRTHTVSATRAYKFFALVVTRTNGFTWYTHVSELRFYGHRENDLVRFPDSVNTLKYPHVAMTGPAQRGYVASASSEYSNGDYPPYNAFNNVFTGSDPTHTWNSKASAYHTSSDGQYNGSDNFSTTISGTAYAGEWIQIELPRKVVASALKLGSYGSNSGRSPRAGAFAGSNDGSTWDLLKTYSGETSWTQGTLKSFAPSNNTTTAYKYFRFVITHVQVTNDGLTALQAFEVHGTESGDVVARVGDGFDGKVRNVRVFSTALSDARVQEIFDADKDEFGLAKSSVSVYRGHLGVGTTEPKAALTVMDEVTELEEFPPRAMTADETYMEGHGVFKASVSEGYARTIAGNASGDEAWLNFDKTRSNWTGGNSYTGTSNTYAGTHTSGGYGGDYIELTLPYKIKLQQFIIQPSAGLLTRWSKSGVVVAKNANHDTWTNIFSWSGSSVTDAGAYSPVYFRDVDATNAYDTFRLVITSVDSQPYVTLWQWRLFGTREQGASTLHNGELSLTRNLTVPRIGPPLDADDTPRRDRLVVEYNTTTNPTENGVVKDTSGRGLDGLTYNGASYDATEKALVFDGSNDYVFQNDVHLKTGVGGVYSASVWVRNRATTGLHTIYSLGTYAQLTTSTVYIQDATVHVVFYASDLDATYAIPKNSWTHIVVTHGGGPTSTTTKMYINGVDVGLAATSGTSHPLSTVNFPSPCNLFLGKNSDNTVYGGPMDLSNFKLWDTELSAEDAKQLYDMGRCDEGHHVVNFSKTRVGIGLGDGEAPRAALEVRGDIYGGCPVFFHATRTTHAESTSSAGFDPLIWQTTRNNKGGGYSTSTGKFTAPIAGYYEFFYGGMSLTASKTFELVPKLNNVNYPGPVIYSSPVSGTAHRYASMSAIVYMNVGDTWHLRMPAGNQAMYGTNYHYNGFTGKFLSY